MFATFAINESLTLIDWRGAGAQIEERHDDGTRSIVDIPAADRRTLAFLLLGVSPADQPFITSFIEARSR